MKLSELSLFLPAFFAGSCSAAGTPAPNAAEPLAPAARAATAAAKPAEPGGIAIAGEPVQGGLVRGEAPPGTIELLLDGVPVPLAPDRRFVLGFDRDNAPFTLLVARLADGRAVERRLSVAPRAWSTQHVNIGRRPDASTAEFLRIREGELARIAAARALRTGSEGWRQSFTWPARGRISGVFGSQRIYRGEPGSFHSGVDVAPGAGAAVVAPADGTVVLAGQPAFSLEGNLVIVDHGLGLNSAFLHLASVTVVEGQQVRQGERIGSVGATGRATGPHLHWSMKWLDARIDPASLAGQMSSR